MWTETARGNACAVAVAGTSARASGATVRARLHLDRELGAWRWHTGRSRNAKTSLAGPCRGAREPRREAVAGQASGRR